MKKQINDLLLKMQNGENCIGETANQLLDLFAVSGSSLLNQCLKEQEEIVSSPIRFNGIHINKLKQVFLKNGIEADELGF